MKHHSLSLFAVPVKFRSFLLWDLLAYYISTEKYVMSFSNTTYEHERWSYHGGMNFQTPWSG